VTDPDPEDEVDDVEGPEDRTIVPPHPYTRVHGVADEGEAQGHEPRGDGESDIPGPRRLPFGVLENLIVQSPTKGFFDLFQGSILDHEMERAMELLEFVGIANLAEEKAKNLSYGQKKLMEFAATLMTDPEIILLDEPAAGINPRLLEDIEERIRIVNGQGITFLIVEHNMDVVMNLCDPVIVMAYGTVLAQGAPELIQNDPQVLEAYLGEA